METIDDLNAQLLDAQVENAAKHEELKTRYQMLHDYIESTLKDSLGGFEAKIFCSDTGAKIDVGNSSIDLYLEKPWNPEDRSERTLKINFPCFGSFGKSDVDAVKFCKVLGHVAGIMDSLEQKLIKADEAKALWSSFDAARRETWHVEDKIRNIKSSINDIETASRKDKIMSSLVVGCKIITRKSRYGNPPTIKTIEHITSKNILFKEDWGKRTKKDELVQNILCDRWQIA